LAVKISHRIVRKLVRAIRAVRGGYCEFKDRLRNVDVYREYGTRDWVQRHPKTEHDVEAPKVNANVYIATRAISDAIKGLPANVMVAEISGGIRREVDDNDHEANTILQNPNPEHSWSDIADHFVKSYLNDGNALYSIERQTGPNGRIEIWPRDPRNIKISKDKKFYKFGSWSPYAKTYKRVDIVHIRDLQVDDPFWGVGRVTTIREEIMMDHFINRFNSRFFENGATLNLMFTPDHDLSDDQHEQILDAISGDTVGAERAFRLFVNKYAGKFEWPEQRHKDLAFGDLLKMNREKTFGVYGLPPFRGGIMEYSNYANAVAQDLDFWLNTVKPIIKVFEDGINKQLIWPLYGPDVCIRLNLDSVPAIRGNDGERADRLVKLKESGIVSAKYVREQLDISEDAAPDDPDSDDAEGDTSNASKEDESKHKEAANALYTVFKMQRAAVIASLSKMTANGAFMRALVDPEGQGKRALPEFDFARSVRDVLLPILKETTDASGMEAFSGSPFTFDSRQHADEIDSLLRLAVIDIDAMAKQTNQSLVGIIADADRFSVKFRQMERRVRGLFSDRRADEFATTLMRGHMLRTQQWIRTIARDLMFTYNGNQ
jgi:HK97 family phage portal protein